MSGASDLVVLARVAGSLVVVVIAAILVGRFARRTGVRSGGSGLRVAERVGLSREAGAVVLEADGRRLLLGVTAHSVAVLAELTPAGGGNPSVLARIPTQAGSPGPRPATSFPDAGSPTVGSPDAGSPTVASPGVSSRRQLRESEQATRKRRAALPPNRRGSGSVLDPRTWQQGLEALRDLTARKG